MGAVAAVTERVRLLPMVLNNLHHEPGVLAKESSILAIGSGGRFELGIGAGDWPSSFEAWGRPFPPVQERLDRLVETIEALRRLWTGSPVTYSGDHVVLSEATCTPAPAVAPRVVAGIGRSRGMLARVLPHVDEVNVYDDAELIADTRSAIAASGRQVGLSVFLSWEWDQWPEDPGSRLDGLQAAGVERACVSIGGADMIDRVATLAAWAAGARPA